MDVEWMPIEQMLAKEVTGCKPSIGLPAEQDHEETRIALIPSTVAKLVKQGYKVIVERNDDLTTCFSNYDFAEAGAILTSSHCEVFFTDIVIRVSPPDMEEIELMKPHSVLISSVVGAAKNEKCLRALIKNRITAISFEHIQNNNHEFLLRAMLRNLAGNLSVTVAASLLSNSVYGQGRTLSGFAGIAPANIIIIGANEITLTAANVFTAIGANVKVLGQDVIELYQLSKEISNLITTEVLNIDTLQQTLQQADIVLCTLQYIDTFSDFFIPKEIVMSMKKGAVIMDLSTISGGVFETSHPTNSMTPSYIEHNILHYCLPNITTTAPYTASLIINNAIESALLQIGQNGDFESFLRTNEAWRKGVYIYKGYITNVNISQLHNMPYQSTNVLMAIFNQ